MAIYYKHLRVLGYWRKAFDWDEHGERFYLGHAELVVRVEDEERGLAWEMTADGERLTAMALMGHDIDHEALRRVPLRELRDIAAQYLQDVNDAYDEGAPLDVAIDLATLAAEHDIDKHAPLTLTGFAAAWRKTPPSGRREALARAFKFSLATVDRWTRQARDAGLLDPPKTGRPRNDTSPPADEERSAT